MSDRVVIKVGPVGVPDYRGTWYKDGLTWDEGERINVRQMFIFHGDSINSIQMAYDDGEKITMFKRHGGTGDNFSVVNVGESEQLIEVSGYYGSREYDGPNVIRSLKFTTGLDVYGPYGVEEGTPFTFKIGPNAFGGFHGRSTDSYLTSIGIYVKTLATHYEGMDENDPEYRLFKK